MSEQLDSFVTDLENWVDQLSQTRRGTYSNYSDYLKSSYSICTYEEALEYWPADFDGNIENSETIRRSVSQTMDYMLNFYFTNRKGMKASEFTKIGRQNLWFIRRHISGANKESNINQAPAWLSNTKDQDEKPDVMFLDIAGEVHHAIKDLGGNDTRKPQPMLKYLLIGNRSESPQRMLTSLLKSEEVVRRPLGDVLQ